MKEGRKERRKEGKKKGKMEGKMEGRKEGGKEGWKEYTVDCATTRRPGQARPPGGGDCRADQIDILRRRGRRDETTYNYWGFLNSDNIILRRRGSRDETT